MPWAVLMEDGTIEYHLDEPTYVSKKNPGNGRARGTNRSQIPRMPGPDEDWDFITRAFVTPVERAAERVNLEHEEERGVTAAAIARAIKLVEARMILRLPTSVELEANALGIPMRELAETIIGKAQAGTDAEIQRIQKRRQVRGA